MSHLKLAAIQRFRPRALTLVLFFTIAALLVLANISPEEMVNLGVARFCHTSYGWPLTWHRYVFLPTGMVSLSTVGHFYSAPRLAANLATWLALLAAPTVLCEWRLRRRPAGLRWSLRTLLAAVGIAAVICGWFVRAREQADKEDALIAEIHCKKGKIFVERFGPRWLAPLGVDRFRRRIMGVSLGPSSGFGTWLAADNPEDQETVRQLAHLPGLRHFFLSIDHMTPQVADSIGRIQRLRTLSIHCWDALNGDDASPITRMAPIGKLAQLEYLRLNGIGSPRGAHLCFDGLTNLKLLAIRSGRNDDPQVSHECLAAIGKMTRLEDLVLRQMAIDPEDLGYLKNLPHLKCLCLDDFTLALRSEGSLLRCLPALERLEILDLSNADVSDVDLRKVSALPHLSTLCLANTRVTEAGLSELVASDSLEELEIDIELATPAGLKALGELNHLKTLHINRVEPQEGNSRLSTLRSPDRAPGSAICDLETIQHAMPGVIVDDTGHSGVVTPASMSDVRAWIGFGIDSLPDVPSAWLPSQIPPQISATQRAVLKRKGLWARFDAAGITDDNGREIRESF